jgi:hypothetical protein
VDGFAKRSKVRVANQTAYYSQKDAIEQINRMAALISRATEIAKLDSDLAAILLVRGG